VKSMLVRHSWILGLLCLLTGGWQMYLCFSGVGTLGLIHLIVGLFTLGAGVYNLVMHVKLHRRRKQ